MRSPSRALVGLSLSLLVSVAGGCKGLPQPPQQRTEGLIIDLGKVVQGKRSVEVAVKITNDLDLPVSFDLGDVRLICGDGMEKSPTPQRGSNQRIELQQKFGRDFKWSFPIDTKLPTGTYTVRIKSLRKVDVELANPPEFQINL